jgi:hypothetical protein
MTNPTPSVAPGWYQAGIAGQQRWWTGTEWSEITRPTPYSEKWDRPGWGANPEVMVVLAALCGVLFIAVQIIVLGFLASGDIVRGLGGFLISLAAPTFSIVCVMSARIGFRRRRLGRPAAGESRR